MSLQLDKLNELIEEIKHLDEEDTQQVVLMLENYIKTKRTKAKQKPSDYIGALKHMNIDAEEECKELRKEWTREWE